MTRRDLACLIDNIEKTERRFDHIDRTLATLVLQGVTLMAQNQQISQFLDELDQYTSALATAQATQTAKIQEIAADIDALLAEAQLDPAVTARLQAASDGLAQIVTFEQSQADTLTAIAAKNDDPLPAPVVAPVGGKRRK